MNAKICNLNTTFENSSLLMIHTVSKNTSVIADFENGTINLLNSGRVVDKIEFGNMSLADYENYLVGISKHEEQPKNINL
jgi:hypothetical protein